MLYANKVWVRPVMRPNVYRRKMGKSFTNLNRYISVITNVDEKLFVIFEHTINHLSLGYVHLSQLEHYFSRFVSFFDCFYSTFFIFIPRYLL